VRSAITAASAEAISTASVTTPIAASATSVLIAIAVGRGGCGAVLRMVRAVSASDFAILGEVLVQNVFFGIGLVEVFVVLVLFIGLIEFVVDGIVEGVLFFEIVLLLLVHIAGAGDLVDGHLTDHGAKVGGAFEGLLFFEVVHLFDGAGVQRGVVVLLVDDLFFKDASAGSEVRQNRSAFDRVLRRVGDCGLVQDGRDSLSRRFRSERGHRGFGVHVASGVERG